ncbi:MAG: TonB-dependent receptor, partial [Nitrospinae bacterium]|nr:TonB-dependent receptor [Nitrospinota bacterium]
LDILRDKLGLDIILSGTKGASASVFTRGAKSDSTLVMIDGVQVNSNTLGNFNFGQLNLDNIEQIEILRGPQSTLWGADAVGGVINIVTKKGKGKPSYFASFEGGSFSTFKETLGSSGSFNKFDYSFTASRLDTEGISSVSGEKFGATETDAFQNLTVSTRMGYNLPSDWRVEFIGRYGKSNLEIDDFQADSVTRETSSETFNLALPVKKYINDWWEVTFRPSFFFDVIRDAQATKEDQIYNRNLTMELQNNMDFGEYYSLAFGMEYQKLAGHNVLNSFKHDTHTNGYYLQTQFDYQDTILLTGGFRHDTNTEFDDATTFKIAGAYRFHSTGTRLHTSYATGFKAPTFNQQFFPDFGTTGLKPEESRGWEVGVNQVFWKNRLSVKITYFEMRFTNLIESVDTGSFIFRARNVGKAKTNGIETGITAKLPGNFSLAFNHSWLETRDQNRQPLQRRAKHKFSATLSHVWREKLTSLIGLRFRSGVKTNSSGTKRVDAYTLIRTAVGYQLTEKLRISARIENLLDEDYEEVFGFGTPGVEGYAGFTYTF